MSKNNRDDYQSLWEKLSVECFNKCWEYIDKESRSVEDNEEMILLASTSLWSWKNRSDCTPQNLSTAYWQMERVHCLSGNLQIAEEYGKRNVEISKKHQLPPFFLGYAYENLVQCSVLSNNLQEAKAYLQLAKEQLERIKIESNRELLSADLETYNQAVEK
ncbi:MAG: hypothetical protein ABW104_15880 [Candidatus Thiodiazotropha sp. 6PLUC2]